MGSFYNMSMSYLGQLLSFSGRHDTEVQKRIENAGKAQNEMAVSTRDVWYPYPKSSLCQAAGHWKKEHKKEKCLLYGCKISSIQKHRIYFKEFYFYFHIFIIRT